MWNEYNLEELLKTLRVFEKILGEIFPRIEFHLEPSKEGIRFDHHKMFNYPPKNLSGEEIRFLAESIVKCKDDNHGFYYESVCGTYRYYIAHVPNHWEVVVTDKNAQPIGILPVVGDGYCGYYAVLSAILVSKGYIAANYIIPYPSHKRSIGRIDGISLPDTLRDLGGFGIPTPEEFQNPREFRIMIQKKNHISADHDHDSEIPGTNAPDCSGDERLAKELAAQFDKELEAQRQEQVTDDSKFAIELNKELNGVP